MNSPITCNGNDLAQVCEDLVERNFVVCAVDAMVKTNAGYRVSYFTKTETSQPVTLGTIDATDKSPEGPGRDANKPLMRKRDADDVHSPIGNTVPNIFAGEADSTSAGCETTKATDVQPSQTVGAPVVAVEHAGNLSIESRMAALQAKLAESGKLRRSKPKLARLPYAD